MTRPGLGWNVTFSTVAGGSNISIVTIQVVDNDGNAVNECLMMDVWLSSASTGIGYAGVSDTFNVVSGGNGTDMLVLNAADGTRVLTSATGTYDAEITDAGKAAVYVCCTVPGQGGRIAVSDVLETADYG